jgi:hypothetical protein
MSIEVFRVVTPYSLVGGIYISEERVASIFRIRSRSLQCVTAQKTTADVFK